MRCGDLKGDRKPSSGRRAGARPGYDQQRVSGGVCNGNPGAVPVRWQIRSLIRSSSGFYDLILE